MDHIWTRDPEPNGEHPVVALLAVVAIVLAILVITWARIEVHGTQDLEAALSETDHRSAPGKSEEERAVDEAVTTSRFATGLSH
ncbi:MAG TPA: hypothetical protein VFC18_05075 [Burkholderiales bacterium]|nr:hypothetical protein [Burkholderiales bacterium]